MAKELHIQIDSHIGLITDCFGWPLMGFMPFQIDWALEYETDIERLVIHMNSPGGDVMDGYAIYNKLLSAREQGIEVEVQVEGKCYSIATLIALAASPGLLKMRRASEFMVHKPLFGQLNWVNADDLRKMALDLDKVESTLAHIYQQKTGKSAEEITALMREETYMTPAEALEYGFCDAIIDTESAAPAEGQKAAKAIAYYKPKPVNTMTEAQENSLVEKVFAKISAFLTPKANNEPGTGGTPTPEPAPTANEPDPAPANVDKETTAGVQIEIDGELAEGSAVYTKNEDGTRGEPLADGEYELTSGETITVAEGKITAVTQPAEAVAMHKTAAANAKAQAAQLQARVTELEANLAKALKAPPAPSGKLDANRPQVTPQSSNTNTGHPLDGDAARARTKRF